MLALHNTTPVVDLVVDGPVRPLVFQKLLSSQSKLRVNHVSRTKRYTVLLGFLQLIVGEVYFQAELEFAQALGGAEGAGWLLGGLGGLRAERELAELAGFCH